MDVLHTKCCKLYKDKLETIFMDDIILLLEDKLEDLQLLKLPFIIEAENNAKEGKNLII